MPIFGNDNYVSNSAFRDTHRYFAYWFLSTIPIIIMLLALSQPAHAQISGSACDNSSNVGQMGAGAPCANMLIVNKAMIDAANDTDSYQFVGGSTYGGVTVAGTASDIYPFGVASDNYTRDNATGVVTLLNGAKGLYTGQITDMTSLFSGESSFNEPIGYWDVSNVTNMALMFVNATSFNQNIGGWDTGNVTDMSNMLFGASLFDGDIGSWDTGKVQTMHRLFYGNA